MDARQLSHSRPTPFAGHNQHTSGSITPFFGSPIVKSVPIWRRPIKCNQGMQPARKMAVIVIAPEKVTGTCFLRNTHLPVNQAVIVSKNKIILMCIFDDESEIWLFVRLHV